jgi:hypothetical protein
MLRKRNGIDCSRKHTDLVSSAGDESSKLSASRRNWTMTADPQSIVLELWWEENDLHVITLDGRHTIYENATITDHKIETESSDVLVVESVSPAITGTSGDFFSQFEKP